jgi:hypothetical protein
MCPLVLADKLLHYVKCQVCNNEVFSHIETQGRPFSKDKNILDTHFQNSGSSAITAGGGKNNIPRGV